MKRIAMCLFLVLALSTKARCSKCDTIDFYWVYYNDTVWMKLNEFSSSTELHLKRVQMKNKDFIAVDYWTDTPCPDCPDSLEIMDNKGNEVYTTINKNTREHLFLETNKLLDAIDKGATYFKFYYSGNRRKNVLLFRLDIE